MFLHSKANSLPLWIIEVPQMVDMNVVFNHGQLTFVWIEVVMHCSHISCSFNQTTPPVWRPAAQDVLGDVAAARFCFIRCELSSGHF